MKKTFTNEELEWLKIKYPSSYVALKTKDSPLTEDSILVSKSVTSNPESWMNALADIYDMQQEFKIDEVYILSTLGAERTVSDGKEEYLIKAPKETNAYNIKDSAEFLRLTADYPSAYVAVEGNKSDCTLKVVGHCSYSNLASIPKLIKDALSCILSEGMNDFGYIIVTPPVEESTKYPQMFKMVSDSNMYNLHGDYHSLAEKYPHSYLFLERFSDTARTGVKLVGIAPRDNWESELLSELDITYYDRGFSSLVLLT